MRILVFLWLSLMALFNMDRIVAFRCLQDQRLLLLQLKSSLKFNSSVSVKLAAWDQSVDCCSWEGVTCDKDGRVTALELSSESISGVFSSSSSLFSLQSLRSLNLANNTFYSSQIPSGFDKLGNLTYLNLSGTGFSGQIPIDISRLTRLVVLDISSYNDFIGIPPLKLENPDLRMLVQNLKELRELHLHGVDVSASGKEWCHALSSSVPNLQVLSLPRCFLYGPIDSSLVNLRLLSVIRLDGNHLAAPVPEFFANFSNLTSLTLSSCGLYGRFPDKIFQVPTLRILDLSNNKLLGGSLPEFAQASSLRTLVLTDTKFSGYLPDSMDKLEMLSRIELARCSFSGPIPNSIANLRQLVYLDMSENGFTGSIPPFSFSKNLTRINLSRNYFSGQIISHHWEGFLNLVSLDLHNNLLQGRLPLSLFSHSSLQKVWLNNNQFSGQLHEFSAVSYYVLEALDLSSNNLEGPIPLSLFDLRALHILELSFNRLNGTLEFGSFRKLGNLTTLGLSYNELSINLGGENSASSRLPQFSTLKLASCKLRAFPDLRNQSEFLGYLDLSDNQIGGEIPNWIWKSAYLNYLNLSHNLLEDLQEPLSIPPTLSTIDLHSNQLHGRMPAPPLYSGYVDYSNNNFASSIPGDIGECISYTIFFSLSKNNITGAIPSSLCSAIFLQFLDLSNNGLSGTIPSCLVESWNLEVLNLGSNNLSGIISGAFADNCSLHSLDLNGNLLEGTIPQSLANCKQLEVLNLGNNRINGIFPCWLKSIPSLRVFVLRSNQFHGPLGCPESNSTWPMLQIIDLASNNFTGKLPENYFSWKAMMADEHEVAHSQLNHLQLKVLRYSQLYYQDAVTVISKGLEMKLVKILSIYTAIDLSCNNLQGDIQETIGALESLYVLNLSHNGFTGQIPSSLGNLKMLESLDLSSNNLSGEIPTQLASLNFLSFLNLSFNHLVGKIPTGDQFQTFSQTSFEGNAELCGFPLNENCKDALPPPSEEGQSDSGMEINWVYIAAEIGYATGLGIVIGPLMFWKRWRRCYYKLGDRVIFKILRRQGQGITELGRRDGSSGKMEECTKGL